jgi:nicotinate-nucleotide adenylyltransferase
MDLSRCQRLIVFGGSFDPPHLAHVNLPRLVLRAIDADAIAYIPAARQPLKLDQLQTPAIHRLAMLRLALADVPATVILTDEMDRAGDGQPSYTVNTLKNLRHRLDSDAQMRLLIGADQLRLFDQWQSYEQVITLAEPIVMLRPPDTRETLLAQLPAGLDRSAWAQRIVSVPQMKISSKAIRKRVSRRQTITDLVHPNVGTYIAEHALYRTTGAENG